MRAIILAVSLALSVGGFATSAKAQQPSAAEQADMRAVEAWLAELARWTQGYQSLQYGQIDLVATVVDGLSVAIDFEAAGDQRGGVAWAQQWRAEREAEISEMELRFEALAPAPPPLPAVSPILRVRLEDQVARVVQMPASFRALQDDMIADTRAMMDVIVAIAGGDERALQQAPGIMFARSITMSRSSIALQETALSLQSNPEHPQAYVLRAGISVEQSMILLFELLKVEAQGGAPDYATGAVRMRERAAEVRAHADAMQRSASATQRDVATMPAGSFRTRIIEALVTYDESAEADRRMAAALDQLAGIIAHGSLLEAPDLDSVLVTIEQLAVNRVEIDNLRRAQIAS